MTKREAQRQNQQESALLALGFTVSEAEALRRISLQLHSWYEKECGTGNGCIERDDQTDKPYWLNSMTMKRFPIADRERGALRRLEAIMNARNAVGHYIQTDPRGASLYIIRPDDIPSGADIHAYYTRGIVVY